MPRSDDKPPSHPHGTPKAAQPGGFRACAGEDLNLHGPYRATRPSTLRVYQFRHQREGRRESTARKPSTIPFAVKSTATRTVMRFRFRSITAVPPKLLCPGVEHPREARVLARVHQHQHDQGRREQQLREREHERHAPQSTNTVPAGPPASSPTTGHPSRSAASARHRRQQPARRLRVARDQPVGLAQPAANSRTPAASSRFVRVPPGTTPASTSSRTPGSTGTASMRSRACSPGAGRQLACVADQPEPGHVGDRVRLVLAPARPPPGVQRRHRLDRCVDRPPRSAPPRLIAVATMPVPSALLNTSTSPGAPAACSSRSGRGARTRSPPSRTSARRRRSSGRRRSPRPPLAATSAPPRRISPSSSIGSVLGNATTLSANAGRAPIA